MTLSEIAASLAAVVQQAKTDAATGATPFFSNDLPGALKVLGVFGTMLGTMIALVVKLTQGKYAADVAAVATDLTELGKKVDRQEASTTRIETEQRAHERDITRHTAEIGGLLGGLGELRASVEAIRSQGVELHSDIMGAINASATATTADIRRVEIEVVRLQERDKLAYEIERLANNLAPKK